MTLLTDLAAWFDDVKAEFILNFIDKNRWRMLLTGLGNTLLIALLACLIGMTIFFSRAGHYWQKAVLALAFTVPVTILAFSRMDIAITPILLAAALFALMRDGRAGANTAPK